MPTLALLRNAALRAPMTSRCAPLVSTRSFQISQSVHMAYKDDQDRESLKPKANEYTQSGTDDQVAANEDAAFNPNKTSPETEKSTAGQAPSGNGNPLEASPANKDVASGGAGHQEDKTKGHKKKSSGGGDAPKRGKVNPVAPGDTNDKV